MARIISDNGLRRDMTPAEESDYLASRTTASEQLADAKRDRRRRIREEGDARVEALIGDVAKAVEEAYWAIRLLRRETKGNAGPAQVARLDAFDAEANAQRNVRQAQRDAIAAVDAATTIAEVEAVVVAWP